MNDSGLGITKENLLLIVPPALTRDPAMMARAAADAEAMAARLAEIDRVRIISNIDGLDETVLDILARDFKVDWWDPEYSIEEKRRTLKGSWRVHKTLGTKAAVETAIRAIYPLTTVEEWFEYGGEPYHFRLNINITSDSGDKARQKRVLERLNFYKSLRSHNDGVRYFLMPEKSWAVAGGGFVGSRGEIHTAVTPPALKKPGTGTQARACGALAGTCRRVDIKPEIPPLEKPGAGTQTSVCWVFGGMRQHIGANAATPDLERPQGAARTAARAGCYGSCQRVSVAVDVRGGANVPTGKGACACSAGTFHTYQRVGVYIPAV